MNCETVRDQLNAWCDRQLEPAEAAALDAHFLECAECRAAGEALRSQDAALRRAFQPQREAAERIAARIAGDVVGQLELNPLASVAAPMPVQESFSATRLLSLLFATAAGFLLAIVIFQPWKNEPLIGQPTSLPDDGQSQEPPVAQLVAATGNVDVRQPGAGDWQATPSAAVFTCPSGSEVRTGASVQCELKTPGGGVIRLNDDTQIKFASHDTIEIERGQIWCSSPESMAIKVLAPAKSSPPAPADKSWALTCASDSCMQTAVEPNGGVQVSTSAGEIDVLTPSGRQRLKRGETISIVKGAITKANQAADPLLSARWTQPLLIRKGYNNRELGGYVDQLLARVGQSKVSYLFEQDIRSLGEYAALPLIRYVESPLSKDDPHKREVAMRIVADIAPSWTIADLIGLLGDADPQTRYLAATTLHRLTGIDQGHPSQAWREDLAACQPAIELWRQWWADNHKRYPSPPTAPNLPGSQA